MQIILENTGRRFNRDWIFRNISYTFSYNTIYGITGPNGSGKSTFIQLLSGHLSPSEGKITFSDNGKKTETGEIFRHVSLCSPGMELYEELTLSELVSFHRSLKPLINKMSVSEFISTVQLQHVSEKPVRLFSSGMKQRVKLGLAVLSQTKILLLDEPCSNFDATAVEWYKQLLAAHSQNRLVVIASNNYEDELTQCGELLKVENFK
ncbi:MAG: ABC transporter ATP-binding protein [Bacteroidota bacterium]